MTHAQGLRLTAWALLAIAVLFYVTSTSGLLFGGASPWNDLGVYAVTVVLLGFALGAFLLRWARRPEAEGDLR